MTSIVKMMNNNSVKGFLCEKVNEAKERILPLIENLTELQNNSSYDYFRRQYDIDDLDVIIIDIRRWQRELFEFFLVSFGEKDSHFLRFKETITETNYNKEFDAKRSLKRELMDSTTYLEAIIPYIEQIELNKALVKESNENERSQTKTPKLFISHSSNDKVLVEGLVSLLEFLGFKEENMFCSSIEGYGIPLGNNIFDYLRSQFENHLLFILFIHSPRYYNSSVSLNEMGAAWVLKQKYFSILSKDISFEDLKGVVYGQDIAIKVNTNDAKLRMNELKKTLQSFFSLPSVNESRWETIRDRFLKDANV